MADFVTVALTLAASELAKGVAGEAAKSLWKEISAAYVRWRGTPPKPEDLDPPAVRALAAQDPGLGPLVERYYAGSSALRRAKLAASALRGAKILWVDDHPAWNALERQTLTESGCVVTPVETTRSAVACLKNESFDLVISDIKRGGSATEGKDALPTLLEARPGIPVIFYVGHVEGGVPEGAFGITAAPAELFHLCMDVVERSRL